MELRRNVNMGAAIDPICSSIAANFSSGMSGIVLREVLDQWKRKQTMLHKFFKLCSRIFLPYKTPLISRTRKIESYLQGFLPLCRVSLIRALCACE